MLSRTIKVFSGWSLPFVLHVTTNKGKFNIPILIALKEWSVVERCLNLNWLDEVNSKLNSCFAEPLGDFLQDSHLPFQLRWERSQPRIPAFSSPTWAEKGCLCPGESLITIRLLLLRWGDPTDSTRTFYTNFSRGWILPPKYWRATTTTTVMSPRHVVVQPNVLWCGKWSVYSRRSSDVFDEQE